MEICLADFATMYTVQRNQTKKRKKQKILRYVRYNKQKDPENYYRKQCLLYLFFVAIENEHCVANETWMAICTQNESLIN